MPSGRRLGGRWSGRRPGGEGPQLHEIGEMWRILKVTCRERAVSLTSASRRGWAGSVNGWAGPGRKREGTVADETTFFFFLFGTNGKLQAEMYLLFARVGRFFSPFVSSSSSCLRQCVYVQCLCTSLSPSSSSSSSRRL